MASKQHGLDNHIHQDRENMLHKNIKALKVSSRPPIVSRQALGEVGNKLPQIDHKSQVSKPENPSQLHAFQQALKKEGKTVTTSLKDKACNVAKENNLISIAEKIVPRRQDSLIKPSLPKENKAKSDTEKHDEIVSYSSKQLNIIDPDASSRNEPQMVVEYLADIFAYLRELEDIYPVREKFLESHRVTPRMRAILVNWLVEVHMNFKFCLETLHMCVSLIDRYLQDNKHVGRDTLQLVGTSAMLVASKYEEMYIPELSDFVYICDDTFSGRQILLMEIEILKKLNFNLGRPLSIHFLRRYSKIAQVKPEHHNLSKYILELALLDYETCHFKPSLQAAAACCLSIAVMSEYTDPSKAWTPTLVHYTTYKYSDLKSMIVVFANLLKKAETLKNHAIREKYAASSYGKISLNMKLKGHLIRKLTLTPTSVK